MTKAAQMAALVVLSVVGAGCDDKKATLAPAASSLAPAAAPKGASVKKFDVTEGKAAIEMDAPKEKIRAAASGALGHLDVDVANLAGSRGELKFDLTTLVTTTFPEADKNAKQTEHARTWLEVADGADGKVDEATKNANRYVTYAIRAVENASATDLTKVAPTKDGSDDVRTVTLTTKGELLLHGHKSDREAEVEVAFHYDGGAAADAPKAAVVKTKKPFHVTLADHDVKPRDSFGKIAKGSFHLLGTKVADIADIALDLRAKRLP